MTSGGAVEGSAAQREAHDRVSSAATVDLDEGLAVVRGLYCDTRQRVLRPGKPYGFEGSGFELDRLRLNSTRFASRTRVTPCTPRPFHVANFGRSIGMRVGSGPARAVGGRGVTGVMLSASEDIQLDCTSAPMIGLVVPSDEVETELRSVLGEEPHQPVIFEPQIDLRRPNAASLYRLVRFLFDELGQAQTLLDSPLMLAEAERMLRSGVVFNLLHSYSARLARGSEAASLGVVRRVEEYIEAHAGEPIDNASLSRVSGCSSSAVYKAFRRHRQLTPMQILRTVRLERANQDLRRQAPGTTVTSVALRWGFVHLGRFSVEYRARFGERPSETLGRSRRRSAAEESEESAAQSGWARFMDQRSEPE